MRNLLLLSLLFVSGCDVLPTPGPNVPDGPVTIELKTPVYNDDEPILAYAIAKSTGKSPAPTPGPDNPDDTPKVGDTCPVCDGRGKSGDGINPCMPCRADGRVDEGDPILTHSDEVTDVAEESILIEYARKDELERAFNSVGESVDELSLRIEETNQKIDDIDLRLDAVEASSPPQEKEEEVTPHTQYRIKYNGEYYDWDEQQRAFIHPVDKRRINFTGSGGIDTLPAVQVCFNKQCVSCTVEKF